MLAELLSPELQAIQLDLVRANLELQVESETLRRIRDLAPVARRRVLEAVQQLGYTPNAIARGLVTNRTQLVGVIVSDVTNPFYPEFLEASGNLLAERGFRMVFHNGAKDEGDEELPGAVSGTRRSISRQPPVLLRSARFAGDARAYAPGAAAGMENTPRHKPGTRSRKHHSSGSAK